MGLALENGAIFLRQPYDRLVPCLRLKATLDDLLRSSMSGMQLKVRSYIALTEHLRI
jgi:hypothetical protein